MQKMIHAIKTFRTQSPASVFAPPLPSNIGRKASGVRFKQTASVKPSESDSGQDNNMDKAKENPTEKTGDVLSHSFGEGYATRCDDDGFGGIYGGNESVPKVRAQDQLIHENHPAYDKSQGSEVKEKERARHQTGVSA